MDAVAAARGGRGRRGRRRGGATAGNGRTAVSATLAASEVPGAVDDTRVGRRVGRASPSQVVEETVSQIECTVGATRALYAEYVSPTRDLYPVKVY